MATPVLHATPMLESGDRLSPEEFDRIYAQCSEIHKAELIDGVVYVASPVRIKTAWPAPRRTDDRAPRLPIEGSRRPRLR